VEVIIDELPVERDVVRYEYSTTGNNQQSKRLDYGNKTKWFTTIQQRSG
jgi:hypothetical protein